MRGPNNRKHDMIDAKSISAALEQVRSTAPLVHNITNYVVMNNTANALLALGASPVMAHAQEEVEDMVGIASALVINMGTLSEKWVEAMLKAGKKAKGMNTPIVFDPVGVGATAYRTEVAQQIIAECQPSVIRGNASEIMALRNANIKTKGVDSSMESNEALESALELAKATAAVVVISGPTDYITDGEQVLRIFNGNTIMAKVTGMGCTASALCGAFVGAMENKLLATACAMGVMGISGELAAAESAGPGSMQLNFLDKLYQLDKETIEKTYRNAEELV